MEDRKAFKFYRSYYDVAKKLPEEERIGFLWAIIEMQFTGEEPEELSLMADLAFTSQKHSILKQLEGYRHGFKGGRPPKGKQNQPLKGRSNQEQEKEQEKEQEQDKEEYTKGDKPQFNFKSELIIYGFDKELVSDWLKVRSKKKATNSQTALKGFIKQVEATGKDKNEVLTQCVENSWSGFKADWIKDDKNGNQFRQPTQRGIAQSITQQREDYD